LPFFVPSTREMAVAFPNQRDIASLK